MKTFTLDEAQALLPVVESLLVRASEARDDAGKVESALQELNRRIHLSGGIRVDVGLVARQRTELEAHMERMRETLAEIDEIGVQVKDLEKGLIDFPCKIEEQIVLLCWQRGEPAIEFWHTMEGGFAGRQAIDERFRKKTNSNSRLN
jgi:hypothetical protein